MTQAERRNTTNLSGRTVAGGFSNRRGFIGGADARIIMGQDEKALIRLWQEERGEWGPRPLSEETTASGFAGCLLAPGFLPEPDPSTTAILFDEVDSGLPKSGLDFLSSVSATAQKAVMRLEPLDRRDGNSRSRCQPLL
jgi:hypothetical protein